MPLGLCNAPATFQQCMTAIFHELMEDSMEVFMDDFSVFGDSFDRCLANLEKNARTLRGDQLDSKLGKMPFYGKRRDCAWAQSLRKWN